MKQFIKILIILLFCFNNIFAQDSIVRKDTTCPVIHSIYVEILGASYGSLLSLNYEIRYHKVILRTGFAKNFWIGEYTYKTSDIYAFPIEILVLSNYHKEGTLEFGAFLTASVGERYIKMDNSRYGSTYIYYNVDYIPGLQFGFRGQSFDDHFIMRIDFTLLFLSKYHDPGSDFTQGYVQPFGGLTFGYHFKPSK
jgi:hypothetical protein